MISGSGAIPYWIEAMFEATMMSNNPRGSQVLRYYGRRYFVWTHEQQYTWGWGDLFPITHVVYQERDPYGNWSTATAFLANFEMASTVSC